jgi:opacity protein-like surface antigen
MWHRPTLLLALVLSSSALAQEAQAPVVPPRAEDFRDLTSARAYGMGGAWRALGTDASTGTGNPATVGALRNYRLETTGAWDWVGKDATVMASVADASTSALAAGATYQFISLGKGAERATAHLNTLTLALPLVENLLIGASGRYLVMSGARNANALTMDAGLLLRPSPRIAVGASAHNLIDTKHVELTRYYSAHIGVLAGQLSLAGDVRADFQTEARKTFTYSGGVEYVLGENIPVRAGYTWDGFTRSSQLGLGLGVMTAGGGIDVGYRHDFGGEKGKLLSISFKVQVQ